MKTSTKLSPAEIGDRLKASQPGFKTEFNVKPKAHWQAVILNA